MEVGKEIPIIHLLNKSKRFIVAQYERGVPTAAFKHSSAGYERVQIVRDLQNVSHWLAQRRQTELTLFACPQHIRFLRQAGGQLNPRCFSANQRTRQPSPFLVA